MANTDKIGQVGKSLKANSEQSPAIAIIDTRKRQAVNRPNIPAKGGFAP